MRHQPYRTWQDVKWIAPQLLHQNSPNKSHNFMALVRYIVMKSHELRSQNWIVAMDLWFSRHLRLFWEAKTQPLLHNSRLMSFWPRKFSILRKCTKENYVLGSVNYEAPGVKIWAQHCFAWCGICAAHYMGHGTLHKWLAIRQASISAHCLSNPARTSLSSVSLVLCSSILVLFQNGLNLWYHETIT